LKGLLFHNNGPFLFLRRELERFLFVILPKNIDMEGCKRSDIRPGLEVMIVQKHHQRTGELTSGIVKNILTNSANHPHGIKVRLETGEVGRVKQIINPE